MKDITVSHAGRDILFGSMAGVVGKFVEYPADTIKVRLQAQPICVDGNPKMFSGPLDCLKKTITKEGFRGLYKGLSSPLVGAILENATLFTMYNKIQTIVRSFHTQTANDYTIQFEALTLPQLFLSGALAGTCSSFLLTPIELIQTRLQVQALNILHTTSVTQKASALTNSPVSLSPINQKQCFNSVTSKNLTMLVAFTSNQSPSLNHSNVTDHIAKRRVIPSRVIGPYNGPIDVLVKTFQTHGIRGVYKGHLATLIRETGGGAAWFGMYEVVARHWIQQRQILAYNGYNVTKSDLVAWELMSAGAAAGFCYNIAMFPADVIKSRLQTQDVMVRPLTSNATPIVSDGFIKVGLELFRTEGVRGLYRGCLVTMIKSTPTSAVIFGVYEWLNRTF